jgi:hypothetical protein
MKAWSFGSTSAAALSGDGVAPSLAINIIIIMVDS